MHMTCMRVEVNGFHGTTVSLLRQWLPMWGWCGCKDHQCQVKGGYLWKQHLTSPPPSPAEEPAHRESNHQESSMWSFRLISTLCLMNFVHHLQWLNDRWGISVSECEIKSILKKEVLMNKCERQWRYSSFISAANSLFQHVSSDESQVLSDCFKLTIKIKRGCNSCSSCETSRLPNYLSELRILKSPSSLSDELISASGSCRNVSSDSESDDEDERFPSS